MIERFGHDKIRLVKCPVCRTDLSGEKPANHIENHSPTDFGLTPEGVIQ